MDKQSKVSIILITLTVIILAALGYLPVMAYQDETPTDIPEEIGTMPARWLE